MVSFTTLFVAASTAASAALATPIMPRQMDIPANWTWHVTNWTAGCGRANCYYTFNVTVPSVEGVIGGVKAQCGTGYEDGIVDTLPNLYTPCRILEGANNGVAAKFGARQPEPNLGFGPKEIFVSFTRGAYEERPEYNFTGSHATKYNQFVAPEWEFDMVPTSVSAVA